MPRRSRPPEEIEGARETVEATLPALVTAQKGLNEPRYPALAAIMKAKKMAIKTVPVAELAAGPGGRRQDRGPHVSPSPRHARREGARGRAREVREAGRDPLGRKKPRSYRRRKRCRRAYL